MLSLPHCPSVFARAALSRGLARFAAFGRIEHAAFVRIELLEQFLVPFDGGPGSAWLGQSTRSGRSRGPRCYAESAASLATSIHQRLHDIQSLDLPVAVMLHLFESSGGVAPQSSGGRHLDTSDCNPSRRVSSA